MFTGLHRNKSLFLVGKEHYISSKVELPSIDGSMKEMEFDEMWHFIGSKKQKMAQQSGESWNNQNCLLCYWQW